MDDTKMSDATINDATGAATTAPPAQALAAVFQPAFLDALRGPQGIEGPQGLQGTPGVSAPGTVLASSAGAVGDARTDDAPALNSALALPATRALLLPGIHALSAPLAVGRDTPDDAPGFAALAGLVVDGTAYAPQDNPGQGAALVAAEAGMAAVIHVQGPGLYAPTWRNFALRGNADRSTKAGLWLEDAQGSQRYLQNVVISDVDTCVLNQSRNGRNGEGLVMERCQFYPNPGGACFVSTNGQSFYNSLLECVGGGAGVTLIHLGPDLPGGSLGFGMKASCSFTFEPYIDPQGISHRNTLLRLIGTDGSVHLDGGGKRLECLGPTSLVEWAGGALALASNVTVSGYQMTGFRYEAPFLDGTLTQGDGYSFLLAGPNGGVPNANHTIKFTGCTFDCDAKSYQAPALGPLPALPRPDGMPLRIDWERDDQSLVEFERCTWAGDWGDLSALFAHPVNAEGRAGIAVNGCWRQSPQSRHRALSAGSAAG